MHAPHDTSGGSLKTSGPSMASKDVTFVVIVLCRFQYIVLGGFGLSHANNKSRCKVSHYRRRVGIFARLSTN